MRKLLLLCALALATGCHAKGPGPEPEPYYPPYKSSADADAYDDVRPGSGDFEPAEDRREFRDGG